MYFLRTIAILTFAILLTACGKSMENDHSTYLSSLSLEEIIQKHTVSCQNSECPEAVAKVIVKSKNRVGQCSGFLVAPNMMMTNGHCLPKAELKSFHQCSDKIAVLFPTTTNATEENARCKKVHRFQHFKTTLDYLIFELDRNVDRKFLKLDQSGVGNMEDFTTWTMNPVSIEHGHFIRKQCKSILNSLLIPEAKDNHFPINAFGDCLSIPGNSGSPIIDSNGKVRAIVAGVFKEQYLQAISMAKLQSELRTSFLKAENVACMDLRSVGLNNFHPDCKKYSLDSALRVIPGEEFKKKISLATSELKSKIMDNNFLNEQFQYRSNIELRAGGLNIIKPFINCVNDDATIDNQLPEWQVKIGYNKYLQAEAKITELKQNIPLQHTGSALILNINNRTIEIPNCSNQTNVQRNSIFAQQMNEYSAPVFQRPLMFDQEDQPIGMPFSF